MEQKICSAVAVRYGAKFIAVSTLEAVHELRRFESVVHCFVPRNNIHIDTQHTKSFSLLTFTGHVTHQQFNIQQLYALPTLYLCVLYLSENKQRLVPLTA